MYPTLHAQNMFKQKFKNYKTVNNLYTKQTIISAKKQNKKQNDHKTATNKKSKMKIIGKDQNSEHKIRPPNLRLAVAVNQNSTTIGLTCRCESTQERLRHAVQQGEEVGQTAEICGGQGRVHGGHHALGEL